MKKNESKSILDGLSKEKGRKTTSIYLLDRLWKDFQKACKAKNVPVSVALEKLISDFLESEKK